MKSSELACNCAYNLVLNTAGLAVLPFLWSKTRDDEAFRKGRVGWYDPDFYAPGYCPPELSASRMQTRIWFHAASVGEVNGAVPTLYALRDRLPEAAILLTVGTPQGFNFARAQLPAWAEVLPFPLDFPWVLDRAFRYLQPDLYVALESEFWPNVFRYLARRRVPALLLNGHLSSRSARRYQLLNPLFQPIFRSFHTLVMLTEEDRRNALSLGASPERTLVLGSSKYDGLALRARTQDPSRWIKLLGISPTTPVAVGGSLRKDECIQLLEAFQAVHLLEPRTVGIFAPRHMDRITGMAKWLESRNIPFHLLSSLEEGREERRSSVVLVDRIGVLFELYALGDLIFCGGTLEPVGGHNIVEPAAWKKPVFYGPHLQKVLYEHTILQKLEGSFLVNDAQDLIRQWSYWIQHLSELEHYGRKAGEALGKLGGVAAKQVELILSALSERGLQVPGNHAKA